MHRGVHFLSTQATTAFEEARRKVAALIGAGSEEVVFTKNATEALNLVAYSWALANLKPGDEVRLADHTRVKLSMQATTAFEVARRKVAALIGADSEEVVFTKNAIEALNLVAYSWALANLKPGTRCVWQ